MFDDIKDVLKVKPGLTGRQIARNIGEERKVVNSFLSKNLDSFEKDDDHCWTLKQVSITKVEFPSKWVDEHIFEKSLKPLNVDSIDSLKEIHFIFPEDCKFLLIAIARFLALANQLKDGGYNITIDMGECRNTLNFFSRNGFFDYLDDKIKTIPARPKSSLAKRYQGNSKTMLELGDIDPNERNRELIILLGERFIENSSEQYALAAKTVFSELIGNVKDHSDSKIIGLAGLQLYKGKNKHIQTIVSDSGVGIAATLRSTLKETHPKLYKKYRVDNSENNAQLVLHAFTKGEVSRYGKGRGLGFKSSREHATKDRALISIRQEDFSIELEYINGDKISSNITQNLSKISGTHICFDFYIDNF
ncbi:ATP-binding protein [Colwellia sp. 4_MG-2023]|uniref:ATP-binding protein n=1 Tax=unclassified Colwellia TaxID=196834 RepID=UPI0026E2D0CA|nr:MULTISPECIES: ATP-binding protein [unclassified Colwellia]MDO6507024.1 ATP-binding protein [Colwellia sp. 5_MG-2023]MDO6555930.1 ATP-binding protein [Colwellia sp. 4_MG-2023]